MSNTPKFQTSKDKLWTNDKGLQVEYARTTQKERDDEKLAKEFYDQVTKVNTLLEELKEKTLQKMEAHYAKQLQALGADAKKGKGNFEFTNMEKTFKVERKIQDRFVYDPVLMEAAKQKHDEYIKTVVLKGVDVEDKDNMLVEIINDAYTNTKGAFDAKAIARLLQKKARYKGEKHRLFHEGCDLILEAQRVDGTTPYVRFYVKGEDGKFQNLSLNFSSL